MDTVAISRSYASCIRDIRASMLKTHKVNRGALGIFNYFIHLQFIHRGQLRNPGSTLKVNLIYATTRQNPAAISHPQT
jgi:hypothetical protein